MKFTNVKIENYKGLRDTECRLSDFVCVIGENNAGKSSLLQAILLFINGNRLPKEAYYDPDRDIVITIRMIGVDGDVLDLLTEDHRPKLSGFVENETLTLARRYSPDGTSSLRVVTHIPAEKKLRSDQLDLAFKGKKGKELAEVLKSFYPEAGTTEEFNTISTQKAAKELVELHVAGLPPQQLTLDDIPLPTGIDNSIRAILPEPIYIPAVKDLMDDLKTKEGASFGKLLNILLGVIEEELSEAAETFENLRRKLNRVQEGDGSVIDDRMERVVSIEKAIQSNLKEAFRDVQIELEIPPPEMKAVLSNATILADDGVRGPVDQKGDGFKRAITFSILRTYVQLSQDKDWRKDPSDTKPVREKFLFLFEEPELYLHPRAQNILFDALSLISKGHQVVATTHSPFFFSSNETTTFAKISKQRSDKDEKPYAVCRDIDIGEISERDKFQIISFESSNQAFFSKRLVLVEGDSELIVLPHVARVLDSRWDFKSTSTGLIKISGKGSFRRYREFFDCFDVEVSMVADLDVLVDGFEKLGGSEEAARLRQELLQLVDQIIADENLLSVPNPKLIRREVQRERFGALVRKLNEVREQAKGDETVDLLNELFSFELTRPRIEVLRDHSRPQVLTLKRSLLSELRRQRIYVLERGAIEDYYPAEVLGGDKPSKAQSYCRIIATPSEVTASCDEIEENGSAYPELELIMRSLFDE